MSVMVWFFVDIFIDRRILVVDGFSISWIRILLEL